MLSTGRILVLLLLLYCIFSNTVSVSVIATRTATTDDAAVTDATDAATDATPVIAGSVTNTTINTKEEKCQQQQQRVLQTVNNSTTPSSPSVVVSSPVATPPTTPNTTTTTTSNISSSTTTNTPVSTPVITTTTETPTLFEEKICYTNLTKLYIDTFETTIFQQRVFILCPNTIFTIDTDTLPNDITSNIDTNDNLIVSDINFNIQLTTQHPIYLRSNTIYQCGYTTTNVENIDNKCIIQGGKYQIIGLSITSQLEINNNIQFVGITFTSSTDTAVVLANYGTITFTNCIFNNHWNIGGIFQLYNRETTTTDSTSRTINTRQRLLQNSNIPTTSTSTSTTINKLSLLINNCIFYNNSIAIQEPTSNFKYGLLSIKSTNHIVQISNTTFLQNNYYFPNDTPYGYLIEETTTTTTTGSSSSSLQLYNNCFINNYVFGTNTDSNSNTPTGAYIRINSTGVSNNVFIGNYHEQTADQKKSICQLAYNISDSKCYTNDDDTVPTIPTTCRATEYLNSITNNNNSTTPTVAATPQPRPTIPTPPIASPASGNGCTIFQHVQFSLMLFIMMITTLSTII